MRVTGLMVSVALAAGLAACGASDGVRSGDGPAQPGIYAFDTPGLAGTTLVLHENGDYVIMADNQPRPVEEGTWRRQDGDFCMDDGTNPATCYAEAASGDQGDFSLTAPNGESLVFRQRAAA